MNINRIPIYLVMSALLTLLVAGLAIAATDQQLNATKILELNDTTVNSTLALYPFFVLDMYELGCYPCEQMSAALSELSQELSGQVVFGTMDAINNSVSDEQYNITAYPTLLIFKNGTLIQMSIGFVSKEEIVNTLRMLKPDLNTSNAPSDQVASQISLESSLNRSPVNLSDETTLKYLDRILEAAEVNHTTGNTINIFIINIKE